MRPLELCSLLMRNRRTVCRRGSMAPMRSIVMSKPRSAQRNGRRLAAFSFGLRAEKVAALWLMLKGYRIPKYNLEYNCNFKKIFP
jgi:hypothetical protein